MPLKDVAALLRRANDWLGTLSVQVDFDRDEITFGKGFSGESGLFVEKGITMRAAVERAMELLLNDLAPRGGEELFLLVNRMRNASYADSYRVAGLASEILGRAHEVMRTRVANYSNITDVYGYDFAILCADGAMRELLADTVTTDSFML